MYYAPFGYERFLLGRFLSGFKFFRQKIGIRDIISLHDQMQNGGNTKSSGGQVDMTQVTIAELSDEIIRLKAKLNTKPPAQPKPSKNRLEVQRLRGIVKSLSDQLEENWLISDSLEHDVDTCVLELEDELREERRRRMQAELENQEYQRFIYRDKARGRRKF